MLRINARKTGMDALRRERRIQRAVRFRQHERDARAVADPGREVYFGAKQRRVPPDDRQSEAQSVIGTGGVLLRSGKLAEHVHLVGRLNSRASVDHAELDLSGSPARRQ